MKKKNRKLRFFCLFAAFIVFSAPVLAEQNYYCKFGGDPKNTQRPLGPNEYFVTLTKPLPVWVVTWGKNSHSNPCYLPEDTEVAVGIEKLPDGKERHCYKWVKTCGNDITMPNGIDRYCWIVTPAGTTNGNRAPASGQIINGQIIKIEPEVIKILVEQNPATTAPVTSTSPPPEPEKKEVKKSGSGIWGWVVAGILAGALAGILLSQGQNHDHDDGHGGSPPGGITVPPGGGPGGETR
ncbi:MAG: hypothetical protein ACPLW9_02820 [Minisyncoccales bacterium]